MRMPQMFSHQQFQFQDHSLTLSDVVLDTESLNNLRFIHPKSQHHCNQRLQFDTTENFPTNTTRHISLKVNDLNMESANRRVENYLECQEILRILEDQTFLDLFTMV